MPNALLLPVRDENLRTSIPALINVVHGYPRTGHKIGTDTGTAPLEDGATITDHAQARPDELNLIGWVSDLESTGPGAALDAWEAIRTLKRLANPVQVITGLGEYREMIVKEAEAEQRGRGMEFTMKLEEIQRVGVQGTGIQATSGPAASRTEEVNRGYIRSLIRDDIAMREAQFNPSSLLFER